MSMVSSLIGPCLGCGEPTAKDHYCVRCGIRPTSEPLRAFPLHHQGQAPNELGMELRDYFAAKALQGQIAALACPEVRAFMMDNAAENGFDDPKDQVAHAAYRYADAMLKAREVKS